MNQFFEKHITITYYIADNLRSHITTKETVFKIQVSVKEISRLNTVSLANYTKPLNTYFTQSLSKYKI
jgi:hypothetical protein